ncbi:MAG TPA: hypothetical protein VE197_15240, partial [Mycobacterium sp.]|nr:hypothetical protein [Mycobacterium sp.]
MGHTSGRSCATPAAKIPALALAYTFRRCGTVSPSGGATAGLPDAAMVLNAVGGAGAMRNFLAGVDPL